MPTPLFILQAARRTSRWVDGPARQHGSVLIQFALFLSIIVLMLGVVDLGYSFYAKRDLQRIADLAALEAAQAINAAQDNRDTCEKTGEKSITDNWPSAVDRDKALTVECGNWDVLNTTETKYISLEKLPQPQPQPPPPLNAAYAVVKGTTPTLAPFPWQRTVIAKAVAVKKVPVASFQVGSQLLRFNKEKPLGNLLGLIGLNVDSLTVLDSEGVANAKISPSGLLKALSVNLGISDLNLLTPEGLANIDNVTLLHLIDASINAVSDTTLGAELDVVRQNILKLGLDSVIIPLGDINNQGGLFAFVGTGSQNPIGNAMDVQLGLSDLLKTAIALGAKQTGNALKVPELKVAGLAQASLTLVEPPTIAFGSVGAQGYSAQIRLNLDVDTDNLLGGSLKWLTNTILNTRVHLPIALDITTAKATLTDMQCKSNPPTIDLSVDSSILNACVGKMSGNSSNSCEQGLQEVELIKLLGLPVLSGKLHIPALSYTDADTGKNMAQGDERSTRPNQLALGNTVDDLVTGLLNLLSGLLRPPAYDTGFTGSYSGPSLTDKLVDSYLEASKDSAGIYNVSAVTDLVLHGKGTLGSEGYMPPLLKTDFTFNNAIATLKCGYTLGLVACPSKEWDSGKFSDAFRSYTSVPAGVLGSLLPIPYDNGYQSCANLLGSLLNWNGCMKFNLKKLLNEHASYVSPLNPDSSEINSLLAQNNQLSCNGVVCNLLKPVIAGVLKPILNGLGNLLSNILTDILGAELGRTDIKALSIECETAQLVY